MIPGLLASILGFYPNASEAALHCKVHFAQRFWPSRLEPASLGQVEEAAGVPAPIIMEKMEAPEQSLSLHDDMLLKQM